MKIEARLLWEITEGVQHSEALPGIIGASQPSLSLYRGTQRVGLSHFARTGDVGMC